MKTYFVVHIVPVNKEGKYLIAQRGKGNSIGIWRQVSGFIKERESAEEAILRELKEETNLEGEIIKIADPFWIDRKGKRWITIASIVKVNSINDIKIDKSEILDFKWINSDDPIINKSPVLRRTLQELGIVK